MNKHQQAAFEEFKSFAEYSEEAKGFVYKKRRPKSKFYIGDKIGTQTFRRDGRAGYLRVTILHRDWLIAHLCWVWHYNVWPTQLDHINGDITDNRISNLREVNSTENNRNKAMMRNNSSGTTGVSFNAQSAKWRAFLGRKYLGSFVDFNAAVKAREAAEQKAGYSERHGT